MTKALTALVALLLAGSPAAVRAQVTPPVVAQGNAVSINLVDADVRAAIQALSPYLDRPVLFGAIGAARVTVQTPRPVPRGEVAALLRSVLASQNLEIVEDGGSYVVRSRTGPSQLPGGSGPLSALGASPAGQSGVQLYVIRLRHAKAEDVGAVVNALYGRASALGELGAPRPATLASDLQRNAIPPYIPPGAPAPPGGGALVSTGQEATLSGNTTIVPDPRTNSLLIRASAADFQLIQAAVEQIDVRPLQVLVEVVIAEVSRNSTFAIGLMAALDTQRIAGHVLGAGQAGSAEVSGTGITLHALGIGHYRLNATLVAAASRGDATILSRPVLFAANNEPATLSVGRQVPFVQATTRTDAGIPTDLVQYRDVSIQLQVTPTISPDGYVMLDVSQEVNSLEKAAGIKGNPIISTRALQTRLLVRDGQTGVLGGLSDQTRTTSRSGIPLLSQLPLVGWAFGGRTRDVVDSELFVFLTPRVIRSDDEMDQTTTDVRGNSRHLERPLERVQPYVQPAPGAGQVRPKPGEGEP